MIFLTSMALRRPTVVVLAIFIVLASGVFAYRTLKAELFPQIEFPLVTVSAAYPSADPEAVVRHLAEPIERAISDTPGLELVQSTSFEGAVTVFANFKYGTDMAESENAIATVVNDIAFPAGVEEPNVGRFNPAEIPVLQFSVVSDRDLYDLQQIVQSRILPSISDLDGIMQVTLSGTVERNVLVTADVDRMAANGVSLLQISNALSENNLTLPAGLIFDGSQAVIAKTTHTLDSVQDVKDLVVGASGTGQVRLSEVADVTFGIGMAKSISRTNGKPGIGISVAKKPDANTVDVTTAVSDALDGIAGLPADIEIIVVSNQGPEIQQQIDNLINEALFGFFFAVSVVFAFMLTIRPTIIRGLFTTLRPTVVIALSIPLSVFTGILLMTWQDMTLNFMTLGGLAISVGRVVDDSIVVLENVHRHIQAGRDRWHAALEGTSEVAPAIFASTLTTVVVFVPLAFIQGLVGSFFLPFALTVTFALIASLLVALTAVPVLSAYLLRPGDLPEGAGDEGEIRLPETRLQKAYITILRWMLGHRLVALSVAIVLTVSSLGLLAIIPVNLFGGGGERYLRIELAMPPGTPVDQTLAQVSEIEDRLRDITDVVSVTVGAADSAGGPAGPDLSSAPRGPEHASFFAHLSHDAPDDIATILRTNLDKPGRLLSITELQDGPPSGGVEISVTGANFNDISSVSGELVQSLSTIDGIVNLKSSVSEARPEISIEIDPEKSAQIGLSTRQVGLQLSRYLIGQTATTMTIDGETVDVVLIGDLRSAGGVGQIESLMIVGPLGAAPLGDLAEPVMREGPVSINRTDGARSASIEGDIVADDTRGVGLQIDEKIAGLRLPPGISVSSGGIFADIEDGFQAIFLAMGIGIVLVYLVMVASLGSLRTPFVIVTTLPLALIGVLVALAITGRSLGLPAMTGILLLIGIVVTNAIVLISFVEQQRAKGMSPYDAMISGARVRLRPILMTALTTSMALVPLAVETEGGGLISAELATVVIGGLVSSTCLTLVVLPIVYMLFNDSIPRLLGRLFPAGPPRSAPASAPGPGPTAD